MRFSKLRHDEQGMALILSVMGLVVIGALVAGSFFVGRVEQVTGYNTVWASQAGEAAEAGLGYSMTSIDPTLYEAMAVWSPAAPTEMVTSGSGIAGISTLVYTDSIRRLNNTVFLVRSTGRRVSAGGQVLASQTLAQLIRLAKPTVGVNAAVTVQDPIKFNGNSFEVDGYNQYPPGWGASDCPTGGPQAGNADDVVGIRSSTGTGMTGADDDNVTGFPTDAVANDPTITSDTFRNFLDYTYWTLSSQPGVKILPNTTPYNGVAPVLDGTGACDKTAALNLGEPRRGAGTVPQCKNYFPIVHGTGAQLKFASNTRGQGILLVDGDLELVGGFEWTGLIIVRGQMKVTGTGNKINGAILTEGVDIETAGSIGGNAEVTFSKCAIDRAVNGAAQPAPVSRGWAQLY
jgi:hypothetical protein